MTSTATTAREVPIEDLKAALWEGAKGLYPAEAAVLLLTHHGGWLRRGDFRRFVILSDTWDEGRRMAWVDWKRVYEALTAPARYDPDGEPLNEDELLGGSGSEMRMLMICCSLGAGTPLDLSENVASIDTVNMGLVLAAVAHNLGGFDRQSLYPWPT